MKQVTFTTPMVQKKYIEVEEQATVARVVTLNVSTDPKTFKKIAYIQVAIYTLQNEYLRVLDPVTIDPMPSDWTTSSDTLDGKALNAIKGTFSAEAKTGIADGTVGTFDAVKGAEDIAAAEAAKVAVVSGEDVIK